MRWRNFLTPDTRRAGALTFSRITTTSRILQTTYAVRNILSPLLYHTYVDNEAQGEKGLLRRTRRHPRWFIYVPSPSVGSVGCLMQNKPVILLTACGWPAFLAALSPGGRLLFACVCDRGTRCHLPVLGTRTPSHTCVQTRLLLPWVSDPFGCSQWALFQNSFLCI